MTKYDPRRRGNFVITYLNRKDLEWAGFDASSVDDATMWRLARRISYVFRDDEYWLLLEFHAAVLGIPQKADTKGKL